MGHGPQQVSQSVAGTAGNEKPGGWGIHRRARFSLTVLSLAGVNIKTARFQNYFFLFITNDLILFSTGLVA
jgi:hypothetical protein